MKRSIRILHLNPSGSGYTLVFEWNTNKKGTTVEVVSYLVDKFQHPHKHPAGYAARPITTGDRIELVMNEGSTAGNVIVFEMVTPFSFTQL